MTQRTLAESLAAYADSDYYPFHMPGHKRRLTEMLPDFPEALQRAARLDITEIDGFDNLHDPEGILKDAEEKAAGAVWCGQLLLQCQRKHGRASDRNFSSSAGGWKADSGAQLPQGGLP